MEGLQKPCASDPFPFYRITDPGIVESLHHMLGLTKPLGFLGSMCVSLERSHLPQLVAEPYWVCEKTDGTRFLMYVTRYKAIKLVALVGRRPEDVYITPITKVPRGWYQGTVLDGELLRDATQNRWTYMIFDASVVEGKDVRNLPFSSRYAEVSKALQFYQPQDGKDRVYLKVKQFASIAALKSCVQRATRHAPRFPLDGYIFTPERDPVVMGRHFRMFKWKTAEDHTIDFQVASDGRLCILEKGQLTPMGYLVDAGQATEGDILECKLDNFQQGTWRLVKKRIDKTYPNDQLTFQRTLVNIQENITLDELENLAC